ncbi:MAG: rhomboid family intramembrane serine protease [Paracoccaceae bacterium]
MREGYDTPPLNPVPPVVWLLVLPIAAMEIAVSAGHFGFAGGPMAVGWRGQAIEQFALSPMLLDRMLADGHWPAAWLMRFLTYPVVHGSTMHAVFAVVFLLALGKMVAEVFHPASVLAVFFAPAVAGGVVYSLVPGLQYGLIGAFPAVYGLIGAFTFILWRRLGAVNANRARAFTLIGFLLGVQLLFGLLFGGSPEWIADLTGFATGFLLSFVVGPGGAQGVLRSIRNR